MNEKSSKTLNVKYFLVYIIFTILLYNIFYYTSSFSYTKSVESLTLAKIAWPCCVLIGIVLYISQIIKHKNTLVNCGMFLSIYMVLLILLKSEGSLYDIITDSIYSMLWISLLCIFMFYSMKYGMPKGISKECFLFLPIITFIFIQLVISNQAKYYKVITLNPIFYILYLVPFLLLSKKSINSYIGLAIVFTSVVLSHKRTALIILALIAVYCFFVQKNVNQNKTNKFVKNMLLSILFVAAIVFIYDYAVKNFNINWLQRLSTISETGGSGRVDRWRQFFIDMKRSNLFEFIAGHGIVYPYYHNDWMQIFYNTGIIGFILYSVMCVKLVQMYFEMKKAKHEYLVAYGASLIIFFFNSMVGQVIVVPYWFLEIAVFWGLVFGDYYMRNGKVLIPNEVA